ncbi:hypothetical protein ACFQX6_26090 [Streptosporangium lutulentum]
MRGAVGGGVGDVGEPKRGAKDSVHEPVWCCWRTAGEKNLSDVPAQSSMCGRSDDFLILSSTRYRSVGVCG